MVCLLFMGSSFFKLASVMDLLVILGMVYLYLLGKFDSTYKSTYKILAIICNFVKFIEIEKDTKIHKETHRYTVLKA